MSTTAFRTVVLFFFCGRGRVDGAIVVPNGLMLRLSTTENAGWGSMVGTKTIIY